MKHKRTIPAACLLLFLLLSFGCQPTDAPADTTSAADFVTTDAQTSLLSSTDTNKAPETSVTDRQPVTDNPSAEPTAQPDITSTVNFDCGEIMVFGKCESGSIITVNGTYTENLVIQADYDNFIFSVTVPKNKSDKLSITATAPGKSKSNPASTTVKYDKNAEDKGLYVTLGSRIIEEKILTDYYHDDLFTKNELNAIKGCAIARQRAAAEMTDKNVQLIYLLVPSPLTVYPEQMDAQAKAQVQTDNSKLKQATETLNSIEGVTAINLTDILTSHKSEKLYYNTDSHWTELGAFYGYQALMNKISETFPAAAPYSLDNYEVRQIEISDTDMVVYAGLDTDTMFETAPFMFAGYTPLTKYDRHKDESARIWDFVYKYFNGKYSTTRVNNEQLPRGIFLFDSYGLNCISYIAEHFNYLTTEPIWNYLLDKNLIGEVQPDFIITVLSERTVSDLPGMGVE